MTSDARALTRMLKRVRSRRRMRKELLAALVHGAIPDRSCEVVAYYPDAPMNLYQIRQWYEPLRRLHERHPVVVITRSPSATLRLLAECPVPVAYFRRIGEIEDFLGRQDVRTVLYVNNSMRNFQMLRFSTVMHVFVNHGESEKSCMTTNQLRSYNYCFVAGDAAIERITRTLPDLDADRLIPVGRPQVDVVHPAPEGLVRDGRQVVLYAPTWEGDRPSMSYSSVESHGPAIVRALVASGRHRVIFRPHPRTGTFTRSYKAALREITRILREANELDPTAGHIVDTGRQTGFGWQLAAADLCVCDMSSVAFDWLATGKPLFLTRPAQESAQVEWSGLAGALPLVTAQEAHDVVARLDTAGLDTSREAHARLVHHYFGDTAPGACMDRFLAACESVLQAREQTMAQRSARSSRSTVEITHSPEEPLREQVLPAVPVVSGAPTAA